MNKKHKLTNQSSVLQALIRHAIAQATDDIFLMKNWPEENNRNSYGKELILKACRDHGIVRTYSVVPEVKKHVKTNPDFTKGLCDLVSPCSSHYFKS
jgi:hypothetical protein